MDMKLRRNVFVKKCKQVSLRVPLAQVAWTAPDLDIEEADAEKADESLDTESLQALDLGIEEADAKTAEEYLQDLDDLVFDSPGQSPLPDGDRSGARLLVTETLESKRSIKTLEKSDLERLK